MLRTERWSYIQFRLSLHTLEEVSRRDVATEVKNKYGAVRIGELANRIGGKVEEIAHAGTEMRDYMHTVIGCCMFEGDFESAEALYEYLTDPTLRCDSLEVTMEKDFARNEWRINIRGMHSPRGKQVLQRIGALEPYVETPPPVPRGTISLRNRATKR